MNRISNLQNKPKPQKRKKTIFKKRNLIKRKNTVQDVADVPDAPDSENSQDIQDAQYAEAKKGPKKREMKIVDNTQNFDPTDFLFKMNPAIMVALDKRNVFANDDGPPEKTTQAKPNMKEPVVQQVVDDTAPGGEEKKRTVTSKKKTPRDKTRRIPSSKPATNLNIDDFTVDYVKEFVINDRKIKDRLPKKTKKYTIKAAQYHLNNSKNFVKFVEKLFNKYKLEAQKTGEGENCTTINQKKSSGKFSLLLHQKLVRDYLNIYTPYRGLFLYFGLGAGKTCSSIAIAEGLKDYHNIVVLTPASLQKNYRNELKFCGDQLYKKNQFWEFITTERNSEKEIVLSKALNLPLQKIRKRNGAWLVDTKRESNYSQLEDSEKQSIDDQIKHMINSKYTFINYNGLREDRMVSIEEEGKRNGGNYFNNKVIIIDEVHNLISRIVNKLNKPDSISMRLYKLLMDAENCKIVFLSGTPIINYPNEIAIFYNILRGYIKTYKFNLDTSKIKGKVVNKNFIKNILKSIPTDFIDFKPQQNNLLIVTQNPFNFINRYRTDNYLGVKKEKNNTFTSNKNFENKIKLILKSKGINVIGKTTIVKHTCLPDDMDVFSNMFIDDSTKLIKNAIQFQKRIIGLTSYFKSANEKLLPKFNPEENIILETVEMSNYQLSIYEAARVVERKEETRNARKRKGSQVANIYQESTSTYRIFSRAFCNFVFPEEIRRPMPKEDNLISTVADGEAKKSAVESSPISSEIREQMSQEGHLDENKVDNISAGEELSSRVELEDNKYEIRIMKALKKLSDTSDTHLTGDNLKMYSPKFHRILENLANSQNFGTHLLYSNFRTLEGIGILKIVLEANGFVEFKIQKVGGEYVVTTPIEKLKEFPSFALYTGTESTEIKDYTRLCFNSEWDKLPSSITDTLVQIHPNNHFGEVIKCFMITSSGAEGINLKNTRFVHIVEPYWHPVREEQVIGRAVRICSHEMLPDENENRSVKVFKYLTVFSNKQLYGDPQAKEKSEQKPKVSTELKLKDISKYHKDERGQPLILTSDQALNEIANMKKQINQNILQYIKSTAIDCKVYNKKGTEEYSQCFTIDDQESEYLYNPSLNDDDTDAERKINIDKQAVKAKIIRLNKDGVKEKHIWVPLSKGNVIGNIYLFQEWVDNNKKVKGIEARFNNIHINKLTKKK